MREIKVAKNLIVPQLGFGCNAFINQEDVTGLLLPKHIEEAEAIELLDYAYSKGIRLFEATAEFPETEELIGKWLKDKDYYDVVVSTRCNVAVKQIQDALKESLTNLGAKSVGIYSICGFESLPMPAILDALSYLKQQEIYGNVKATGIMTWKKSLLKELLLHQLSVIQIPVNAAEYGLFVGLRDILAETGTKVIAQNCFANGYLFEYYPAGLFLKGLISLLKDNMLMITMTTKEQIDQNIEIANSIKEEDAYPLFSDVCNGCQLCDEKCVNNYAFSQFVKYAKYLNSNNEDCIAWGKLKLKGLYIDNDCLNCIKCKGVCPMGLDIQQYLKDALEKVNLS